MKKTRKLSAAYAPYFIFLIASMPLSNPTQSQVTHTDSIRLPTPKLYVKGIFVSGNKKTKDYIILREMQIHKGDSLIIGNLNEELEKAREFIYNTTLFLEVSVKPEILNAYDMNIRIEVKERWYIFPLPFLELADRSFNEWWKTYDADLSRISYGLYFSHLNFSGRKDQLTLTLVNGFTRNVSFEYIAPYTNPALTDGVKFGAGFEQTREIPYTTDVDNKLQYYQTDHYVENEWYLSAAYSSRKKLKKKETFSIKFHHLRVDDSIVLKYNPDYFNQKKAIQNFIELEYELEYDDVDNIAYPLEGQSFSLSVKKRGLKWEGGINLLSIAPSYEVYFKHPHHWYSSFKFEGEIKLPFKQPYYNLKALGYHNNYLRGQEYFVVDGYAFLLSKMDIKKKIASFSIPTFLKSKDYSTIPFTLYAKTYGDMGYVFSKGHAQLNNRFLYSGGFGIDIVTLYDFTLSIEYSFNQLNQKGLFLHL